MAQKEGFKSALKRRKLIRLVSRLIKEIGDDPTRAGVMETPQRVAKAYAEWFRGYHEPDFDVKRFETPYSGLIVRPGIPFQSFCEHHMARYAGVIHFAYIPNRWVIGLSKIIRLAQHWTSRLSIQEDLTDMILSKFMEVLDTKDVAIVVSAYHTCESTRGVRVGGVPTITARLSGRFMTDASLREEFYKLISLQSSQNV